MQQISTVSEVIDALGGPTKAGEIVGTSPHVVGMWKTRNGIPSEYYLLISAALREKGKEAAPDVFPWLKQPEAPEISAVDIS